jgi:hypothetical protein
MTIKKMTNKEYTQERINSDRAILRDFGTITLQEKFIKYDRNGSGKYNIYCLAVGTDGVVRNITSLVGHVLVSYGMTLKFNNVENCFSVCSSDLSYIKMNLIEHEYPIAHYRI